MLHTKLVFYLVVLERKIIKAFPLYAYEKQLTRLKVTQETLFIQFGSGPLENATL